MWSALKAIFNWFGTVFRPASEFREDFKVLAEEQRHVIDGYEERMAAALSSARERISRAEKREVYLVKLMRDYEEQYRSMYAAFQECERHRLESDRIINKQQIEIEFLKSEVVRVNNRCIRIEDKTHIPHPGHSDDARMIGRDTQLKPKPELDEEGE